MLRPPVLLLTLLFAAAPLAAQAHSAPPSPQGWTVQPIDARRAQVVYTGQGDDNRIRDAALLGAAEMALEQRATWFRVSTEWIDHRPETGATTVALEVKIGEGPTPAEANAFDAAETAAALRPRLQARP